MELLKFKKTVDQFYTIAKGTAAFSNLGAVTDEEAIARAHLSTKREVGRKWTWCGQNGTCVIVAGMAGDIIFTNKLEVKLSDTYKESAVFKQEPELLFNLLEFAFYEGHPIFGVIEALDLEILNKTLAETTVSNFRNIHKTLLRTTN